MEAKLARAILQQMSESNLQDLGEVLGAFYIGVGYREGINEESDTNNRTSRLISTQLMP